MGDECQEPYYDCTEKWDVFIYFNTIDIRYDCHNFVSDDPIHGCVMYDLDYAKRAYMKLGSQTLEDYWHYTPLEHELKHLMCKCNFHG